MDRGEYITHGRDSVTGWFTQKDAMLFDAIDVAQRATGIAGDLLEVGCYQGTSAILLGYMRAPDERLIICDLFDGPVLTYEDEWERQRWYADSRQGTFEANYQRFHADLPEIVAGPSSVLRAKELSRTFRFIHIDGSHAYDVVREDLLLAKDLLIPGGVVVFDDIVSPHTPGVTAAVWEGVANDGLVPMIQTIKLYGTWGEPIDVQIPGGLISYAHTVRGYTVLHTEG